MLSDTESDFTISGSTYRRIEPLSISQEVNVMPARLSASEFTVRVVESMLPLSRPKLSMLMFQVC